MAVGDNPERQSAEQQEANTGEWSWNEKVQAAQQEDRDYESLLCTAVYWIDTGRSMVEDLETPPEVDIPNEVLQDDVRQELDEREFTSARDNKERLPEGESGSGTDDSATPTIDGAEIHWEAIFEEFGLGETASRTQLMTATAVSHHTGFGAEDDVENVVGAAITEARRAGELFATGWHPVHEYGVAFTPAGDSDE